MPSSYAWRYGHVIDCFINIVHLCVVLLEVEYNFLSMILRVYLLIYFIDLFLVPQGCGDTAVFTGAGFPWSRSGEMAGVRTWGTAGGRWKFGYLLTAL